MLRTAIAATVLSSIAAFLLTTAGAAAKGPFSLVISGGDLVEPVTIDGPVADAGMFGPQIDDPQPHPDVIYRVEFFSMDGHRPAGTISYYPAHDGLPAAWQTKYGFWAVPAAFNETFAWYLPSDEGGTSALWYILPGAGLGLVAVAGASAVTGSCRSAGRNRRSPDASVHLVRGGQTTLREHLFVPLESAPLNLRESGMVGRKHQEEHTKWLTKLTSLKFWQSYWRTAGTRLIGEPGALLSIDYWTTEDRSKMVMPSRNGLGRAQTFVYEPMPS